jgi:hypothetical protein
VEVGGERVASFEVRDNDDKAKHFGENFFEGTEQRTVVGETTIRKGKKQRVRKIEVQKVLILKTTFFVPEGTENVN